MKNTLQTIVLLLMILVVSDSIAQQIPSFNLYGNQRFMLNPSYVGENDFFQAFLNSKRQWVGISDAPVTSLFGLHKAYSPKVGLGIKLISDKAALFENLSGNINYSYKLKMSVRKNHFLTFGASLGFVDNKIKLSNAKGDITDPLLLGNDFDGMALDASFGFRYTISGFDLGFAVPQLLGNSISYTRFNGDNQKFNLSSHIITNISYRFIFNEEHFDENSSNNSYSEKFSVEPMLLFRSVKNSPNQIDFACKCSSVKQQWVSAIYRPTNQGIVLAAGLPLIEGLNIAYAYEFNNSKLASYSNGTHEFMLVYNFPAGKDPKDNYNAVKDKLDMQLSLQRDQMNHKLDSMNTEMDRLQKLANAGKDYQQLNKRLKSQIDSLNTELKLHISQTMKQQPEDEKTGNELELDSLKREIGDLRNFVKTIKGENVVELKLSKDQNNNDIFIEQDYRDGCYVVVHSFRKLEQAKRAVKIEKENNEETSILYNKTRNWYYIYTIYDPNFKPALNKMEETRKKRHPEAWVHIYHH